MMDRTDYQILNLLQDDSRCTLRRMGDLVGLTPPAGRNAFAGWRKAA